MKYLFYSKEDISTNKQNKSYRNQKNLKFFKNNFKESFENDGDIFQYLAKASFYMNSSTWYRCIFDISDIVYDKKYDLGVKDDELTNLITDLNKIVNKNYESLINIQAYKDKIIATSDNNKRLKCLLLLLEYSTGIDNICKQSIDTYIENYNGVDFDALKKNQIHDSDIKWLEKTLTYNLVRANIYRRMEAIFKSLYEYEIAQELGTQAVKLLWHNQNLKNYYDQRIANNLKPDFKANDELKSILVKLESSFDIYFRITKLNIAKYYRDYALMNRRSDFDAAKNEFNHVLNRISFVKNSENYKYVSDNQKRQYYSMWLDSMLNLVLVCREKYQMNETIYRCDKLFHHVFSFEENKNILNLFTDEDWNFKINNSREILQDFNTNLIYDSLNSMFTQGQNVTVDSDLEDKFKLFSNKERILNYDYERYFLLLLIELAKYQKDKHRYSNAIIISLIAIKWSQLMDEPDGGINDNFNIDAIAIMSEALRKYYKYYYQNEKNYELDESYKAILDSIQFNNDSFDLSNPKCILDEIIHNGKNGHFESKEEIYKWGCLLNELDKKNNTPSIQIKQKLIQVLTQENINEIINRCEEFCNDDKKGENITENYLIGLYYYSKNMINKTQDIMINILKHPEAQYIRSGTIGLKANYVLSSCYIANADFQNAKCILNNISNKLSNVKLTRKKEDLLEQSTDANLDIRVEIDLIYCLIQQGDYKQGYENSLKLFFDSEGNFNDKLSIDIDRFVFGITNFMRCLLFLNDDSIAKIKKNKLQIISLKTLADILKSTPIKFNVSTIKKSNTKETKLKTLWTTYLKFDKSINLIRGYCIIKNEKDPFSNNPESIIENKYETALHYIEEAAKFKDGFYYQYDARNLNNKSKIRDAVEELSSYILVLLEYEKSNPENKEVCDKIIKRIIFDFPSEYAISLYSSMRLSRWLLDYTDELDKNKIKEDEELRKQLFRSFSYIQLFEERGARVFNELKNNPNFRLYKADERGKILALLLLLYEPIKDLKSSFCYYGNGHISHYTSLDALQKIIPEKLDGHIRLSNCNYMNDILEGNELFKCIWEVLVKPIKGKNELDKSKKNELVKAKKTEFLNIRNKYYPQFSENNENITSRSSNVYLGSFSKDDDSFSMWTIYGDRENGCSIEFDEDFFDTNGQNISKSNPLYQYRISKFTDEDYPLYNVVYTSTKNEVIRYIINPNVDSKSDSNDELQNHISYELSDLFLKWKNLDDYLTTINGQSESDSSTRETEVFSFTTDRIDEIRFLFKDVNYQFEDEVRVIYTDVDSNESKKKFDYSMYPPRLFVNVNRPIKNISVKLGSRIEESKADKYGAWLMGTKIVKKVAISLQNRYSLSKDKNDFK